MLELRGRVPAHPLQHHDPDVHARPWRGDGYVHAGVCRRRAGVSVGDRSARVPAPQPRGHRPPEWQSLVEQGTAGVLSAGRRAHRLAETESGPTVDSGRALADRIGDGHGRLSSPGLSGIAAPARARPPVCRRHRRRPSRHSGDRHGGGNRDDPGRGRWSGAAARARALRPGRHGAAEHLVRGRLGGRGPGQLRGPHCHHHPARSADRPRCRRPPITPARCRPLLRDGRSRAHGRSATSPPLAKHMGSCSNAIIWRRSTRWAPGIQPARTPDTLR